MGSGPFLGADGNRYNNIHDMNAANNRWYQQERQNKLIEEQNKILAKQNQIRNTTINNNQVSTENSTVDFYRRMVELTNQNYDKVLEKEEKRQKILDSIYESEMKELERNYEEKSKQLENEFNRKLENEEKKIEKELLTFKANELEKIKNINNEAELIKQKEMLDTNVKLKRLELEEKYDTYKEQELKTLEQNFKEIVDETNEKMKNYDDIYKRFERKKEEIKIELAEKDNGLDSNHRITEKKNIVLKVYNERKQLHSAYKVLNISMGIFTVISFASLPAVPIFVLMWIFFANILKPEKRYLKSIKKIGFNSIADFEDVVKDIKNGNIDENKLNCVKENNISPKRDFSPEENAISDGLTKSALELRLQNELDKIDLYEL